MGLIWVLGCPPARPLSIYCGKLAVYNYSVDLNYYRIFKNHIVYITPYFYCPNVFGSI